MLGAQASSPACISDASDRHTAGEDASAPNAVFMPFVNDTRICVPVKEKTFPAFVAEAKKAASCADIVELRLDALERRELEQDPNKLTNLIHSLARPVILTFRPAEQGGYRNLSKTDRFTFW